MSRFPHRFSKCFWGEGLREDLGYSSRQWHMLEVKQLEKKKRKKKLMV